MVPPGSPDGPALDTRLRAVREKLRAIVAQGSNDPVRASLEELGATLDAIARDAAREHEARTSDATRLAAILEVLYAHAAMDFSVRAEVDGDGPFDALAQSVNMVAEELADAHHAMETAKAEAVAAGRAKSQFLANMSHEIRTPLTALIGFADLLAAPAVSESERLNYAMIIRRNGDHLLSVINDILDLSKIEAGKLTIEHIECSPVQILSEVASFMRVRAIEANLDFSVDLETPVPALIRSDPTRLRQSLLNLVSNAIKFTERGSVRVLGSFDAASTPPRLAIRVEDTGMGMGSAQIAKLFQPFEQVDASMTRRFGGTGLGLAICKRIAVALGGDVEVTSVVGRGSTFTLTAEAEVPRGTPMIERLHDAPSSQASPGPSRTLDLVGNVLLAEDGPDNQVLVTTLLRKHGLTVTVVANGQLAVEAALGAHRSHAPYDLILMDMQMPVMDGYQAVTRLRHEGYRAPIVALTAHAMDGERERCLAAGCDGYIRKPIDRAELVACLAKLVPSRESGAPSTARPLASSFADDPDMLEVVRRFVGSLPERVAAMKEAAHTGASATLQRLAHQLKGAAGGYGYAPITDAAARVETAIASGAETAAVRDLLEDLVAICMRVVAP
jgi:signal transduction histidine kinase/CheY-like chemotaxis protein/HPt (histidine-containing phosphotransfer) domain-containing protein